MIDAPIFSALADPVRRNLLEKLAHDGPRTATQLAAEYTITRQGIRKHLTILHDAGLVAVHQTGRDMRYSLTPEPLQDIDKWIQELNAVWDARLLRLKTMIENEK